MKTGVKKMGDITLLGGLQDMKNWKAFYTGEKKELSGTATIIAANGQAEEIEVDIQNIWGPDMRPIRFDENGVCLEELTEEEKMVDNLIFRGLMAIANNMFETIWVLIGMASIGNSPEMTISIIYFPEYKIGRYYISTEEDIYIATGGKFTQRNNQEAN